MSSCVFQFRYPFMTLPVYNSDELLTSERVKLNVKISLLLSTTVSNRDFEEETARPLCRVIQHLMDTLPTYLNACILLHTKVHFMLWKRRRMAFTNAHIYSTFHLRNNTKSRHINSSFGSKASWIAATKTAIKSLRDDLNMSTKWMWLIKLWSLW